MARATKPPRLWGSFTARILVLSVMISVVPLLAMGLIYDSYTRQMLVKLNEDRVNRRLEQVAERVLAFFADRFAELEMLSDYPPIKSQLATDLPVADQDMVQAVIEYQPDQTHLYGILLVSNQGEVISDFSPVIHLFNCERNHLPKLPPGPTPLPERENIPHT